MKRSEMLKELYESADRFFESGNKQNFVDFLLNECERLGMHPPTVRDGAGGLSEYWESEDENK